MESKLFSQIFTNLICWYHSLQDKQVGLLHLTRNLSNRVFIIIFLNIVIDVLRFNSRGYSKSSVEFRKEMFARNWNLINQLDSVFLSSAESRRQRLLSSLDMQGEARKKYTTSSLNEQKSSNRRNSSKQHKNLGCFATSLSAAQQKINKGLFNLYYG